MNRPIARLAEDQPVCAVCLDPAHRPDQFAGTYQGHWFTTRPYPGQMVSAMAQPADVDELPDDYGYSDDGNYGPFSGRPR